MFRLTRRIEVVSADRNLPFFHRRALKVVLAACALVAVLCASTSGQRGKALTASLPVKGEWIGCNTVSDSKEEGDQRVATLTTSKKFNGTVDGTYDGTERSAVRGDGSGSFKSSGVFTGEVNGRAGTAVLTYSGTIDKEGRAVAHWVLDQGTDDLARVDGHGTFEGKLVERGLEGCPNNRTQSALAGSYSGTVNFSSR